MVVANDADRAYDDVVANDEDITPGAHDALIATLLLCAQLLVPKNPTPDESELV